MRSRYRAIAFFLFALGLIVAPAAGQGLSQLSDETLGQVVADVVWNVDGEVPFAELADLVEVAPGKVLTRDDAAATLRHLYASGRFEDVALYAEPVPGGVRVRLAATLVTRVRSVSVRGGAPFKEGKLREVVELQRDEPLSLAVVEKGRAAISVYLREQGYEAARVTPQVEAGRPGEGAAVVFEVDAGAPTRIVAVDVEGETSPFTAAELAARFGGRPGEIYRPSVLERDVATLLRKLRKEGYRKADAELAGATSTPEGMRVRLRVDTGPKVRFRVVGDELSRLRRKKLLPFLEEERFGEDLLSEAAERITEYYQRKGYYRAKVTYSQFEDGGEWVVQFVVTRGEKYAVREIAFSGNDDFSDEDLRKLMITRPRNLVRFSTGRLVDTVLAEDLDSLVTFYNLQGHDLAEIEDVDVRVDDGAKAIDVRIAVREGRHLHVGNLTLAGVRPELESELRRGLRHRQGQAYVANFAGDDVFYIKSFYSERGYPDATAEFDVDLDEAAESADIHYRVFEGKLVTVGKVVVQGNTFTRRKAFAREIDVEPGDPYSYAKLLQVQRDLYRLGIFRKVRVTALQEEGQLAERDIVVEVEEGKTIFTSYALGYDTEDDVRATVGASHSNLFGTRRYLGGQYRLSGRERRWNVSYKEPYLFALDLPVVATLFSTEEERRGYDIDRRGSFVELADTRPRRRVALRYAYEIINLSNIEIPLADIERQNRDIAISSLTPGAIFDYRDDPIEPTRGHFEAVELEYAFPVFAADASFVRVFGQASWYRPLGSSVFVLSGRFGGIEPLRDYVAGEPLPLLPNERIPLNERFFGGGPATHRAYERDRLGVPGRTLFEGRGVGGNGIALVNVEVRVPLFSGLGAVVFADSGNVWADYRDISGSELKTGVGVGLRYMTPIGPLRVDYGFKLDPLPGEDRGALYLSIGNPF